MTSLFGLFHLYGLLIGAGIILGIIVVQKASRHFKIAPDWLDQALPWIFICAVIGARIYHLATDWQLYQNASFLDLVAVWRGGIGFIGAVAGGTIGLWLWVQNKNKVGKKEFATYCDLLVFGIPVAQIIGRVGNFVNGELYGLPTNLPWGIRIGNQKYHPLFLYESLLNLVLFLGLIWLAKEKRLILGKGQYASVYVFGYTFIRFWLEYLRPTTARLDNPLGFLSIAQWVCLVAMILSASVFWLRRHWPRKNWDVSLE